MNDIGKKSRKYKRKIRQEVRNKKKEILYLYLHNERGVLLSRVGGMCTQVFGAWPD